jgi:dihydroorotate dehydrogenase (NAD+) catalytic subunit
MTYSVCARVGIPVIGMGGIENGRDAADFMAAGASCVAVGTASFRDPAAGARVASELGELLAQRRVGSVRDAIGSAHPPSGV